MKFIVVICVLLIGGSSAFAQSAPAAIGGAGRDLIASPQSALPQSTEITSQSMETWSTDTETRGIFSGNVVVTGTNLRITCDRLEITAASLGDKTSTLPIVEKFKFLLATGKVRIVQGDREATCGRAEVYPRDDKVILTESPMVIDHGAEAKFIGQKLVLLRGERRVQGDNVQMIFPPIKDLGFDKNAPVPKPDAGNAKKSDSPQPVPTPAK